MQSCLFAWGCLALAVLFWGLSFVGIKIALGDGAAGGLPPLVLLAIRFSIGALAFGPLLLKRRAWAWPLGTHARVLAMAACLPGAYFVLETYAVSLTSASKAALIAACIPVSVLLLGSVLQRRRPGGRVLLGTAVALAGVAGLVLGDGAAVGSLNPGDGLMLLAVLAAAGYMLQADRLGQVLGAEAVTAAQMVWGAVFFLPLGVWQGGDLAWQSIPAAAWIATLCLALFPTLGAFWAYNIALTRLEAGRASLGINLVPLVAALGAWAMLGESLTLRQGLGGATILAGVFWATTGRKECPTPEKELASQST